MVAIPGRICHNAALPSPGHQGCRGGGEVLNQHAHFEQINRRGRP
jgi:hypothetical protein